ncbi:Hypothetical predicted protein [Mytilus galloprovincialis]|uniref:NADP-dependent oxidoreductase domain-containing protein n=1 Tax=Mytilus galloprovincialis TaxID=29158 RepID=A0A8B6G491_MYTGA|nr:Hypothetical predicted protein [Mytilus galloprovincialis]
MSSGIAEFAVLQNGTKYPVIGLGTHNVTGGPGSVRDAVKYAIDIGYRSVDCAYAYLNEKEVGDGIQAKLDDGTIKDKKEIFITTKLWDTHHNRRHIKENFKKSLNNLKVDCVQLLLIHWPISLKDGDDLFPKDKNDQFMFENHDLVDTWKGMEELVDAGMADNIGLSNFNKSQIERILQNARIKPCNLQVVLRFIIQRNIIVIPKSVTPSRIKENFDVFTFSLSPDEMEQIWTLDKHPRIFIEKWASGHQEYPFHAEF